MTSTKALLAVPIIAATLAGTAVACVDPGPPPPVWVQYHPGDGIPNCRADFNGDGFVGPADAAFVQANFGPCPGPGLPCPADLDGDGVVGPDDLIIVQQSFGDCPPPLECVWITIHDYVSFGANAGSFCVCALNALGPIVSVDQVVICDAETGLPVPGWNFLPNLDTGQSFNLANGGGNFVGFLSSVVGTIPPGLPLDIKFKVAVPQGTPFEEIEQALMSGEAVIGTDEGNPDGTTTGHHLGLNPAGAVGLMDPCPGNTNGDDVVNVDDLNNVILDWGTDGSANGGDVTGPLPGSPPDGIVDVNDLNAVIVGWGPCPTPPLIIASVDPLNGGEGTIVKIRGTGFGHDPDDLCIVVRYGDRAVPMRAISATDTEICAVLGTVPPNAQPGAVMVERGEGDVGTFEPAFDDIILEAGVWVWQGNGGPGGQGGQPFDPEPNKPGKGVQWFFSQLEDGKLCTIIEGDWPPNAKIRITARAHTASSQQDLEAPQTRFIGGGTVEECAERIKDVLVCAFQQQTGVVVEAFCTTLPDGRVKITVTVPNEPILWGLFDICVLDCPEPPLQVFGFEPAEAATGQFVQIFGQGFDPDPDNLCAVVMMGQCSLPLQVVGVSPGGDVMTVQVGPVWGGAVPGPIMVAHGNGEVGTFVPVFPDVIVEQPVWIWDRDPPFGPNDDTTDLPGGGTFTPIPPPTDPWLHGEPNDEGTMCLFIPDDVVWGPDQKMSLVVRAHDHAQGIGHDGYFPCMRIEGPGGSTQECAERICDMIVCAFFQQSGIVIDCQVQQVAGGWKITISLPGGFINWGNFDLCLIDESCPWDLNGDGFIDGIDVEIWFQNPVDLNGDGVVDDLDLQKLQGSFGPCPGTAPCPWDLNGDGIVDGADIQAWLANPVDVNGDGAIDDLDRIAIADNFGPCP